MSLDRPAMPEEAQAGLQHISLVLDYSADCISLIDRACMRFIYVNQTACEQLGFSRGELLEMGPQDINPYFNRQMLEQRFDEIIASPERAGIIETTHKRRDGSLFPVEVRVRAVESEGRAFMVAIARNMTVQCRNEEALRQSEEQFRQISENLHHALWIGDVQAERLLYISSAFEKIWGRSRALVYGRPRMLLADIHPWDRARVTAAMQDAWRNERDMDEEYRLLPKDGRVRWLWTQTFPIRDEKGWVYRIGAVTEDITARKAQEESLRLSEEKFRRLFEGAPIGLGLIGADSRIVEANPALCAMLGYGKDELLTRTNADITYPQDVDGSLENVKKLFSGAISHYVEEKRYVRKDGSLVWGKLHAAVIAGHNKTPLFGLGMIENIDQAKRAEALRLERDAAQKNALVREVHHRIKNHLQGVVGLLRRHLSEGGSCNAMLEETIAQIGTVATVHGLQGRTVGEDIGLLEVVLAISKAVDDLIPSRFETRISSALESSPALSRDESVPVSLALNELLVNARKFSTGPVLVELSGNPGTVTIRIVNPASGLPQHERASGLELVRSLLQAEGARFTFAHRDGRFSAEVMLTPPVLKPLEKDSCPKTI